jgi:hypothetical protein
MDKSERHSDVGELLDNSELEKLHSPVRTYGATWLLDELMSTPFEVKRARELQHSGLLIECNVVDLIQRVI